MLVIMGLFDWLHKRPNGRDDSHGKRVLVSETSRLQSEPIEDDADERERLDKRIAEARTQVELERRLMCRRHTDRRPV